MESPFSEEELKAQRNLAIDPATSDLEMIKFRLMELAHEITLGKITQYQIVERLVRQAGKFPCAGAPVKNGFGEEALRPCLQIKTHMRRRTVGG